MNMLKQVILYVFVFPSELKTEGVYGTCFRVEIKLELNSGISS